MSEVKPENRPKFQAIARGFIGRCPNCGQGKLFSGYLTLVERCDTCDEPLSQYDPDLVLALVVGLVVVTVIAIVFFAAEIEGMGSPIIYMTLLVPIAMVVTFLVLRPFKGALTGFLWAIKTRASNT